MKKVLMFFEKFLSYCDVSPGKIEASYKFFGEKHKFHVIFSGVVHGNEVGALPGFLRVIEELETGRLPFGGTATFLVGNPLALKNGVRFQDFDLNRSFGMSALTNHGETIPYEYRRAQEITPLLHQADLLFDFHQTIRPSQDPFYIFAMQPESYQWARLAAGAKYLVTRKAGVRFSGEGLCIDEYMRSLGKPGVTLELGEQGICLDATERVYDSCCRVLKAVEEIYGRDTFEEHEKKLQNMALAQPDFIYLEMFHQEPFQHLGDALFEGLNNLQPVVRGTEIGRRYDGTSLVIPDDGYLFFPKYPPRDEVGLALPARAGGALYVLARQVEGKRLAQS